MDNTKKLYKQWLSHKEMPAKLIEELQKMDEAQITDAFYQDVEFGTAGMRGLLGAGTNRLNIFTIRRAAIGFGNYVIKHVKDAKERGVVIAHDNRHMSVEFTLEIQQALSSLGIKTFGFDELKPTPLLSYAVRYLNAAGGIMVTASHNPKTYNGFKVYDDTGAQLVPDKIELLLQELALLPGLLEIELGPDQNRRALLSDQVEETYFAKVLGIQLRRNQPKKDFKVVFSPQHGTGRKLGMRALNTIAYNTIGVETQMNPDPNFTNTKSPNPEEKEAYSEAIKLAFASGAHFIVTTDPDADRLGIAIRNKNDEFELLTGNQSGALLIDYILKTRKKRGLLHSDSYLYTTIVTSTLGSKIARSYGVKVKEFLTGFKYIGEQIALDEEEGIDRFEFGYEESYGCLIAPFVRDKDAIQALVMYTEMAQYYYNRGKTLDVVFEELCEKHGYHLDITKSIAFPGITGHQQMVTMLTNLRANPIESIAGVKVVKRVDYLTGEQVSAEGVRKVDFPQSDVLSYMLADGSKISIRPSGTEPKCKVYYGVIAKDKKSAEERFGEFETAMKKVLI